MKWYTPAAYLVGRMWAIEEVARSRWSIAVGVLFVLSAGLAREYDGEDLVHEWWHALRPLGASAVSGTVLFLLVHGVALLRRKKGVGEPPGFWRAYRAFMGLFWMTAPMAWLYAVPYERMMTPVGAFEANLRTLEAVSVWRVVLMVRVVGVVYGIRYWWAFFLVMLFADVVMFAAIQIAPKPIFSVMGGMRLSDVDRRMAVLMWDMTILTVFTLPLWIAGVCGAAAAIRPKWLRLEVDGAEIRTHGAVGVALLSIAAFVPLLAWAQPEQINRREVELMLRAGRVEEGLARMTELGEGAFPPVWDPPPRLGYTERKPELRTIAEAMEAEYPAGWVTEMYLDKMRVELSVENVDYEGPSVDEVVLARFMLEHDRSLTERHRGMLTEFVQKMEGGSVDVER